MNHRVKLRGIRNPARARIFSVDLMLTQNVLTARAAARRLGIRASTLTAWNESGVGPLPDARGRYDSTDVADWEDEMSYASRGNYHLMHAPQATDA